MVVKIYLVLLLSWHKINILYGYIYMNIELKLINDHEQKKNIRYTIVETLGSSKQINMF